MFHNENLFEPLPVAPGQGIYAIPPKTHAYNFNIISQDLISSASLLLKRRAPQQ